MYNFYKIALECVSEEELTKIHEASIYILEKRGVVVHHEELREIARKNGAKVENEIVYFSKPLVENAVKKAPEYFELHSRNKDRKITIGRDLIFSPAYGAPFIIDENGRRSGTLEDYINLIKLSHQLNTLNLTGGIMVEPNDLSRKIRHVELLFTLFKYTDKPIIFMATGGEKSKDVIEMTSIVAGGKNQILNNPAIILSVNPVSPLRWDDVMAGTILEFARNRQPIVVGTAIIMGLTGPVTPIGTCILQNAELLSGITFAQMINEGTPVVYGAASAAANMKSASFVNSSPEAILLNLAAIQMAKFYKIPIRVQGTLTDAKSLDYQAGYESSFSLLLQALAIGKGAYFSQAAGILDSYMSTSFEKFIADDEICKRLIRIFEGLDTSKESYALDVIMEMGHEGNYLTHQHTFDHFKERWTPTVADWDLYSDWDEKGRVDFFKRCQERVEELLDSYVPPALDKEVEKDLRKYVENYKKAL